MDDAFFISNSPEHVICIYINNIQFRPDRMMVLYPDHFPELDGIAEAR